MAQEDDIPVRTRSHDRPLRSRAGGSQFRKSGSGCKGREVLEEDYRGADAALAPVAFLRGDLAASGARPSPRGDEARNVARRYLAPGLHLADKLHHRRRNTKGRDLTRHPQEGSRSVGVVHDEELLGVTSATPIGLIPRHTAMLPRQWLPSGDLSS